MSTAARREGGRGEGMVLQYAFACVAKPDRQRGTPNAPGRSSTIHKGLQGIGVEVDFRNYMAWSSDVLHFDIVCMKKEESRARKGWSQGEE
ncbi:hypothetical protein VNI00_003669 [Paramarasmius palmivorus]|uniref:Uncharacterized protein n=1 Tax=Paramarasmius palmivorus TaxID=297713 RepID=A0AAW0DU43_9AGAR